MTNLEKIEKAISALSHDEINQFASWFADFQADLWDKEIASDLEAGRLDGFLVEARADGLAATSGPLMPSTSPATTSRRFI